MCGEILKKKQKKQESWTGNRHEHHYFSVFFQRFEQNTNYVNGCASNVKPFCGAAGGVPFRCGYFALSLRTVSLWRDQNCILCSRWNIMCLSEIDREARF